MDTLVMLAGLAWDPEIRGILTVATGFAVLMGSVWLIVATNSGIRLATPFLLAGLGEAIGQRSGVLNLGVDGVMLLGAFGAYWTIYETQSPVLGVFVGLGVGLVMGVVYAVITVGLRAEQGISGIGIFLFGLGISDLLFQLNQERGTTLVLVTHDERLAHRCQRLIRLEAGHLIDRVEP